MIKKLLVLFALIASLFFEGLDLLMMGSSSLSDVSSLSNESSKSNNATGNMDTKNNANLSQDEFKDIPPS